MALQLPLQYTVSTLKGCETCKSTLKRNTHTHAETTQRTGGRCGVRSFITWIFHCLLFMERAFRGRKCVIFFHHSFPSLQKKAIRLIGPSLMTTHFKSQIVETSPQNIYYPESLKNVNYILGVGNRRLCGLGLFSPLCPRRHGGGLGEGEEESFILNKHQG